MESCDGAQGKERKKMKGDRFRPGKASDLALPLSSYPTAWMSQSQTTLGCGYKLDKVASEAIRNIPRPFQALLISVDRVSRSDWHMDNLAVQPSTAIPESDRISKQTIGGAAYGRQLLVFPFLSILSSVLLIGPNTCMVQVHIIKTIYIYCFCTVYKSPRTSKQVQFTAPCLPLGIWLGVITFDCVWLISSASLVLSFGLKTWS